MSKPRAGSSSIEDRGAGSPRHLLDEAGASPSKSRGQNFLTQGAIADRIVAMAHPGPGDRVLEIGPGLGVLTERILAYPVAGLAVVELDRNLAAGLRSRFAGLEVIEDDFLNLDPGRLFAPGNLKVIGNLPFNVAAPILHRLGRFRARIAEMVLMFQREVGARLRAAPGSSDYGALTVLTAMEWDLHEHFRVQAGSFYPRPRVDAEVIRFTPAPPWRAQVLPEAVREIVRAGFGSRRKSLRNSLAGGLGIAPETAAAALAAAGIAPSERAERLALDDFVRLAGALGDVHRRVKSDA